MRVFWEHVIGARILGTEACGQGIQCANKYIYWTEMGYVICDDVDYIYPDWAKSIDAVKWLVGH